MRKTIIFGIMALAVSAFTSCSSDEPKAPEQGPESAFVEAPKCDGSVTVVINNSDGLSRAANLAGDITDFTATRCDFLGGSSYVMVTYHGRNKAQKGMVHIINKNTGAVVSELITPDARVNYATYRAVTDSEGNYHETVYVGVDRKGADGILCGIIAVPLSAHKFMPVADGDASQFTPYKVEGQSVNCIKSYDPKENNVLCVAAGGNNALGAEGKAGFTKFAINNDNPLQLSVLAQKVDANYRGYWFSYDKLSTCPVAYTYRKLDASGNLAYYVGMIQNSDARKLITDDALFIDDFEHPEALVYTKNDVEDYGRFGVSTFTLAGSNYIVVSTGTKEGGVQVFRHVGADNTMELVDTWHKACVNTSSLYSSEDGKYYIFASTTGGVFKLEIVRDDLTRAVRLEPVAKVPVTELTESGTLCSTNYVQLDGQYVHVAGGYQGYYRLSANDDRFIPADKRVDADDDPAVVPDDDPAVVPED